jgi:hypothetical protein
VIAYRAWCVISIADFLLRYRVDHSPRTVGGNHWPSGWSIWYGHLFLAQRFARHASPLTTTVYTHPSAAEMSNRLRGLEC